MTKPARANKGRYMMILYDLPISSYGCKTRVLLRHKNLQWQSVAPPDGYGSAAYCQIIPAGTIPALDNNGFKLSESEAIAEYINEIAPTPAMLPTDVKDRAIARSLSRFHDTRIEPLLRAYFNQVPPANRDQVFIRLPHGARRDNRHPSAWPRAHAGDVGRVTPNPEGH